MTFDVTINDGTVERIDDADTYQLEGPLTTFFTTEGRSGPLSAFAVRVASLRTDRIFAVRRVDPASPMQPPLRVVGASTT
jgi:hypothetical protein